MIRKIFKTGHSYAVTLSKKLLDELDLKPGDSVSVEMEENSKRIVIKRENNKDQLALNLHIRPKLGNLKAEK